MARLIRRKDGRYRKLVYVGKTADDKKQYLPVYGLTQKEVVDAAESLKLRLGKGLDLSQRNATFKDFAERYKNKKEVQGVSASWLRNIQNSIDKLSPLHRIPIDKIKTSDVQDILDALALWHDGKAPLARKTIANVHAAAVAIFDLAIPEAIQYNSASKCYIPKGNGAKERGIVPTYQVKWIQDTPHKAQRAAMIACYAGLRRGEIAALTWPDITLGQAPTIRVDKSFDYSVNPAKLKTTKTEAGDRLVSIPHLLANYLAFEKKASEDSLYYIALSLSLHSSAQVIL